MSEFLSLALYLPLSHYLKVIDHLVTNTLGPHSPPYSAFNYLWVSSLIF